MKQFLLFTFIIYSHLLVEARIKLPHFFTENMVLQRDVFIPVWGTATPLATIHIQFHDQVKTCKADSNGNWSIKLDPEVAGGPFQLTLSGENTLLIRNILVGDVWLCTGQSNMGWTLRDVPEFAKLKQSMKPSLISSTNSMICSSLLASSHGLSIFLSTQIRLVN